MRTIHFPIYILRPFERGMRETFGKYSGFILPELGVQIPFVQIDDWKRAVIQRAEDIATALALVNNREPVSQRLTVEQARGGR